jgi:mannosyl-oligosaccharide glucosidase
MTVVWPMLLLLMASSLGASDASADLLAIKAQNQSLYWGTYRPNLYFGTRTRAADTNLLTGLIWFGAKDLESGKWSSEFLDYSTLSILYQG